MKPNKLKKKMLKEKYRNIENDEALPVIEDIEDLTGLSVEQQLATLCDLVMQLNNKYNEQKELNKRLLSEMLEVYNLLDTK